MRAKHYLTLKKKSKQKNKKYTRNINKKAGSAKQTNDRFFKEINDLNHEINILTDKRKEYADGLVLILLAKEQLDVKIKDLIDDIKLISESGITPLYDEEEVDQLVIDKYNGRVPTLEELLEEYENMIEVLKEFKSDKEKIDYTIMSFDLVLRELTDDINTLKDQIKYYNDHTELVVLQ